MGIVEICGSSRIVAALVLKFTRCNCYINFLPDAQHLSVVEKSALADVSNFSQSFCKEYASGCIESPKQPSPMEKSSRMSLHYIIQNDGARELVL